jgi:hypothetical protein
MLDFVSAVAEEGEASGLAGRWVRVGCGRVLHVNSSDLLAAPPGSLDPPAGASYIVSDLIISGI